MFPVRWVLLLSLTSPAWASFMRGRYVTVELLDGETCDITSPPYAARGDGVHNDTLSIQKALDDARCSKIIVPAGGVFLVSALKISRSHTELHIEEGATLLVSNDRAMWPGERDVLSATEVEHLAITGGGTVDGQGLEWWQHRDDFRPHLVQFSHVTHAILADTLYLNSPNHVLELYCDDCELAGVKVLAPSSRGECKESNTCSHNTDAVDVHGSPFYVHGVNFTTGDDNVAVHANNTLVEDSYFGTGHGASIGSLCNSWLTGIVFRNITFNGTKWGTRIKSKPNCSGHVWNITYKDLRMYDVQAAMILDQFYDGAEKESDYIFDDILYRDILVSLNTPLVKGPAVQFECSKRPGGEANCDVNMQNVKFIGSESANIVCNGTVGEAEGVEGLRGVEDCLKLKSPY